MTMKKEYELQAGMCGSFEFNATYTSDLRDHITSSEFYDVVNECNAIFHRYEVKMCNWGAFLFLFGVCYCVRRYRMGSAEVRLKSFLRNVNQRYEGGNVMWGLKPGEVTLVLQVNKMKRCSQISVRIGSSDEDEKEERDPSTINDFDLNQERRSLLS
mmetsp:Transcript_3619/g.9879  ORF Transcript_3619/g.9879 Transcript_3619/m.9879 type:complete len:157 (+) Transcript_3619:54-524(+)